MSYASTSENSIICPLDPMLNNIPHTLLKTRMPDYFIVSCPRVSMPSVDRGKAYGYTSRVSSRLDESDKEIGKSANGKIYISQLISASV